MGALYFLFHPQELRSIIQWLVSFRKSSHFDLSLIADRLNYRKMWHEPVNIRDPKNECFTLSECFRFLNLTSRSFAAVIQELNQELLVPITLFYLVLRALDTVEDDMTLPLDVKIPLLRDFHKMLDQDGWQFHQSKEKDRELLEKFDVVVTELKKLKKNYFDIIKDVTSKMGDGMADYAQNDEMIANGVQTIDDYELYCHYAAGLVGEGLTRLMVAGNLANPKLLERPQLTESMGQFLQKTNIIRDIVEDWDETRRWYPKEIWSKHVDKWEDLFDLKYREQALNCISHMVLDALKHVEECLFYMTAMQDQSAFNFVAIPQVMAIATLEKVFRNPKVLEGNVKITRGDACQIMWESTQNHKIMCKVFRRYARRIHQRNDPRDPNFLAISVRCAQIEKYIETLWPQQDVKKLQLESKEKQKMEEGMSSRETAILFAVVIGVLLLMSGVMVAAAWLLGAKFDRLPTDNSFWPSTTPIPSLTNHEEL